MDNIITKLDEKRIDELLAYTAQYTNKNAESIKNKFMQKTTKRRVPTNRVLLAAAIAAVLITMSGIAVAAFHFLTPGEVMDNLGVSVLGATFNGDNALNVNSTQSDGDFIITLMSVTLGNDIPDEQLNAVGGGVSGDSVYALFAIRRADGSPMMSWESFDPSENMEDPDTLISSLDLFYVSPFIGGFQPNLVNSQVLSRFGAVMVIDGIKYILIECGDLSVFADLGVYIGVISGDIPNYEAFILNEETGEILPNPEFEGINVIFELPFDKSLADPEKAQALLNAG
jgi:hypothetical protein